jgi:large repetitive protein
LHDQELPGVESADTNFSFLTQPGQTDERWLIIFDNVVHTGQMACNAVAGHKIWFVNGSSSTIQEGCQNLLIPVEKIDKQNPAGQTTRHPSACRSPTRLTMPVLFDPATGTVIDFRARPNDLHGVTSTGRPECDGRGPQLREPRRLLGGHGRSGAAHVLERRRLLTFDDFPDHPGRAQIVIELTVVLEDTPANAIGTQFVNTAKWDFGRLIDGVFYEPLPGEWGITPPLTIAAPQLVVDKTGPATLNARAVGEFAHRRAQHRHSPTRGT